MKKSMLIMLAVCLGVSAYAQTKFQEGYFINNSGQKVECLIQNDDWKNNPSSFKYKKSESGDVMTATLANTKEFVITGKSKYQKFTVNIDRSSKRLQELNTKRTPNFKSETLFLKVLIEGARANLYSYVDGSLKRYFYTTPSESITQLVYRFYKSENGGMRTNESYKNQLKDKFPCSNANQNVSYRRGDLIEYFIAYNNCGTTNGNVQNYTLGETKGKLRFKIKGGINYYKLNASENIAGFPNSTYDTDSKISPRFGVEIEYLFAGNNNRWSVFVEPSYQSYSIDADIVNQGLVSRSLSFDYTSIEVPVGIRYYLPLEQEGTDIFLNVGASFDLPLDSEINNSSGTIQNNVTAFAGAGYQYQKFSVEARYMFSRNLADISTLNASYGGFVVALGYVLF